MTTNYIESYSCCGSTREMSSVFNKQWIQIHPFSSQRHPVNIHRLADCLTLWHDMSTIQYTHTVHLVHNYTHLPQARPALSLVPFHLGDAEVNYPPRPLPLPLLTQLLRTAAPSQRAGAPAATGGANMPIPHTVIDNRKPLRGADYYFFQVLVPLPLCHEIMPPGRLPASPVPKIIANTIIGIEM